MPLEKQNDEVMPSVQPVKEGEEGLSAIMEEDRVDASLENPTEQKDDQSVMISAITSHESVLLTEKLGEDVPAPGVEAVCALVAQQKENRQKRARVFVERLQRLKTKMSFLDTSRLGRLGADGTLLDENPCDEARDEGGSRGEFVTPRSIDVTLTNDNEGDNDALENPQIRTGNEKHSDSEISNAKLVKNVTAEVEMLNSMKSKPTKKQKVSLKVGLHAKTKLAKGKPKFNNKLSNKKK
ncbi:hypothetical protein KP79_PYT06157 [Mizuhopecten yessoensis]|uniref:Uncharacterized protein n=1 Tax=Mizuhopecten yessoensis TaxID=6573 RepID=A0A210PTX5_MIZYE|nr:hypothetical protein KP79_PYT06157 [Mizuhopecten yessoensis]